jgi:hypothetical protein
MNMTNSECSGRDTGCFLDHGCSIAHGAAVVVPDSKPDGMQVPNSAV